MSHMVEIHKDARDLFEVERFDSHAEREGFRISELQMSTSQKVPWHYHTHIKDTFYVVEGEITIYLRNPKEALTMSPGESYGVEPKRPHLVTNSGSHSATFLVLQGIGEYDFVALT